MRRHSIDLPPQLDLNQENFSLNTDIIRPSTAHSRLAPRPLSDIREDTEPSLLEAIRGRTSFESNPRRLSKASESERPGGLKESSTNGNLGTRFPLDSPKNTSSSSLPLESIPPRRSSTLLRRESSNSSHHKYQPILAPPPKSLGLTIPNHGPSRSPVRAAAARNEPVSSESARKIPSRTFVRLAPPKDILDAPQHRHPRARVSVRIPASLFMGGGTVEGKVDILIDEGIRERARKHRQLSISRLSVDILGVEEISSLKRSIFMSLANELIDIDHPPPSIMLASTTPLSLNDPFWLLAPSKVTLAFRMSLPLNVGPAPFNSRHAKIRYILCATMLIKDVDKQYIVRESHDISILSVFDPEKALVSLPSPLTASDECSARRVWVSGTSLFVDVHVANHSEKAIKRLEAQLERIILVYKCSPAATLGRSTSHMRTSDHLEKEVVSRVVIKRGSAGWSGIDPHTTDTRTCELEVPRGHATVKPGRYFEVRYFLNVFVSSSFSKLLVVQLPVIVIHMNSLDIIPNSIAQVASAIELKKSRRHSKPSSRRPQSTQGRAFEAPRKKSLSRLRAEAKDRQDITREVNAHRPKPQKANSFVDAYVPTGSGRGTGLGNEDIPEIKRFLRRALSNEAPHLQHLQMSTPGLGFTSSEDYGGSESADLEPLSDHSVAPVTKKKLDKKKRSMREMRRKKEISENSSTGTF
ncbi:MAG: hypothetical protein M1819_003864 [Sarea resinae]|nr:MAG: hypothetical protein M1819_003864 [Sarea resinae]